MTEVQSGTIGKRQSGHSAAKSSMEDSVEGALRSILPASELMTESNGSERRKRELIDGLRSLKGVGPKKAEALFEAGFESLEDLALYFPSRYLDARQLVPLAEVHKFLFQPISVRGKVISSQLLHGRQRAHTRVTLKDDSGGVLQLVYFDFPESRAKSFIIGQEYLVAGYSGSFNGAIQIVQPPFVEHLHDGDAFAAGQMLPIYTLPPAIRKAGIKDRSFREIVQFAVTHSRGSHIYEEILPESLRTDSNFFPREEAIHELHFPESPERLELARLRLKYEEIFFLQLRLAVERRRMRRNAKGVVTYDASRLMRTLQHPDAVTPNSSIAERILSDLPYRLTEDQRKSLLEILGDMSKTARSYPMNRLLQGDVGSGKTIVAILAMVVAIENGYQCALMVPTEVLAEQHYATLTALLKDTSIQTAMLVGGQPKKLRQSILEGIASGETHIVVGTHALIEKGVRFDQLGLVITDEQHRFGVAQRKALIDKSFAPPLEETANDDLFRAGRSTGVHRVISPDVLIMTATPIPRTLALTLYGDMDVSTIRELPKNRKPIRTMMFFEHDLPKVYRAARERIAKKGEQVFIVYPLRERSEKVDSEAAEKAYELLREEEFRDLRVGLIHGKLTPSDKQEAMRRFRAREFDVLVATTVIEVGIDVPNATVMIVQHADRFGLAQLHQLRGRVGRGSAESACVLVASEKLAPADSSTTTGRETSDQLEQRSIALERLTTLVSTSDGFEVAKADMEFRGTGEMLGLKQSGRLMLKFANLTRDIDLLQQALADADALLDADPELRATPNRATRQEFLRLYRDAESYLHIG